MIVVLITAAVAVAAVEAEPAPSSKSLAALSAWAAYAQAVGTVILVLLGVPAAYVAIADVRTKRRPVVSIAGAVFETTGLRILLQNVGETSWLSVEVRAWVSHTGPAAPNPQEWAAALESAAVAIQREKQPTFVGNFNALGLGDSRWELLRWGPVASEYDPDWAGEYGIVIWDSTVRDLYGRTHPGSGHTDVGERIG